MADPTIEARLRALVKNLFPGIWQQENICIPAESDIILPHIMGRVPDVVEIGDVPLLSEYDGGQVGGGCQPFSKWFDNEELVPVALVDPQRPEGSPLIEVVEKNAANVRIRNWTVLPQDVGVLIMSRQGMAREVSGTASQYGVEVDFSADVRAGAAPLAVTFTDLTTYTDELQPATWAWTFGDGNGDNVRDPTNNYLGAGTWTVTLTVTFSNGASVTVTKTGYIVTT